MNKPISEKISELRKARSLTQEKLGEQLGVSSQAVSKWEKSESMPDIMMLPKLCEILGITVDALLEVPLTVKKDSCMKNLAEYAKEGDGVTAAFEAIETCASALDSAMSLGSSLQEYNGVRICSKSGIGLVIKGESQINKILKTDIGCIKKTCELLSDADVIKVIRTLDFSDSLYEAEIAEKCGLSEEIVVSVLFKLMKFNYCECDINGKYIFGGFAYVLLAILCGFYLSSADGHKEINSVSRNYPPRETQNV